MLFSDRSQTHYENAPVHEVICQLRFPTILSINNDEPAEFQEAIREQFPQYVRREDQPSAQSGQKAEPISNYNFFTADNRWKLNLTRDFIALSTLHYDNWEEFAAYLDKALAAFIKIHHPAFFQRVGLRYVNLFSRNKLGLENVAWKELFQPAYIGAMAEEDLRDEDCLHFGTDLQVRLDNSCRGKIHAGLARLHNRAPGAAQDPEIKFIFDMDLSMSGNVSCTLAAGALETLHVHGARLFEGAITDRMREALKG